MPHMRCEECGYAWSGPEDMPLSRCPRCGRSDKLVAVEEDEAEAEPAEPDEAADDEGGGFTPSTELALVAAIVLAVLVAVAAVVTLLFYVSGAL